MARTTDILKTSLQAEFLSIKTNMYVLRDQHPERHLHFLNDDISEFGTGHLWNVHEPGEIVGYCTLLYGVFDPLDNEVGGLCPSQISKHHSPERSGMSGLLCPGWRISARCRALPRICVPARIVMFAPGAIPMPPTCAASASECSSVQVHGSDHARIPRRGVDCWKDVGDALESSFPRERSLHSAMKRFCPEFFFSYSYPTGRRHLR